jgi:3-dehydroquinate dehydratase/shikimate dehydrogenase
MATKLIGVARGPTLAALKDQIAKAKSFADLVEIRLDLLEPSALHHLKELPRILGFIFTFRKKSQGGARDITEHERLELFEHCLAAEPQYCDLEADTELAFFERVKEKYPKIKIIGSFHDFEGIPEHLDELFARMHKPQIDHYKVALKAHSTNDALKIMEWSKNHKNLTCIAMGMEGQISRILAPIIGAEFCYAAIEQSDAPLGQLSLKELCEIYRFKELRPSTKIYALLGSPVTRSVGHLFHNQYFSKHSKDAVYIKLQLDIPELPLFFSLMRQMPFAGFSVTMPLKEQMGRVLTKIDPSAEQSGSVNTIAFEEEHLVGYNTDGRGALDVLERHRHVKGQTMVILGAGGTGRAIAFEAMKRGAKVIALNRTLARAKQLGEDLSSEYGSLEDLPSHACDVLVNTIPADLIFDAKSLPSHALVMDIVYWHEETPLLKAAKERGCACIGGIEMFEAQAKLQQEIWFRK